MLSQSCQFCKDPAETTEMLVGTAGMALGATKASAGGEWGEPHWSTPRSWSSSHT